MDYYQFKIHCSSEQAEILIAFLGQLPFETFEEDDLGFLAYMPADLYNEETDQYVENLKGRFSFEIEKTLIKAQNWNEIWESNFEPIIVGKFCGIRADFHEAIKNVRHEIIINPKMAFGTGHHETTFMVIEMMGKLDFKTKKVLDFGCGTGILAILASKLGADPIYAVDIEIQSFENTLENAGVNQVDNIITRHGTLEQIGENGFEIILANINRNVILSSLKPLYDKLSKDGLLIVSGILKKDEQLLIEKALQKGFSVQKLKQKNNWVSVLFKK